MYDMMLEYMYFLPDLCFLCDMCYVCYVCPGLPPPPIPCLLEQQKFYEPRIYNIPGTKYASISVEPLRDTPRYLVTD